MSAFYAAVSSLDFAEGGGGLSVAGFVGFIAFALAFCDFWGNHDGNEKIENRDFV